MRKAVLLISVVVLAATAWILLHPPPHEGPKRPDDPTLDEPDVQEAVPEDAPGPTSTVVGRVTHRAAQFVMLDHPLYNDPVNPFYRMLFKLLCQLLVRSFIFGYYKEP